LQYSEPPADGWQNRNDANPKIQFNDSYQLRGPKLKHICSILILFVSTTGAIGFGLVHFDFAPSQIDSDTVSEPIILPTTSCGRFFIAETYINGQGPFAMLLDTGASKTILSKEVAKSLGIKSRIKNLAIGDLKLSGRIKFSAKDIDHLDNALGINIDGILGHSVFKKVVLIYDYPAEQIRARVGKLHSSMPGIAPMSKGSRPFLGAMIGDQKTNILLDTGSSGGLSLKNFNSLNFIAEPNPTGAIMRIDGMHIVHHGRLQDNVRFGSLILNQPIVKGSVGDSLLGQEILKDYVLSIDQQSGFVQIVHPDGTAIEDPIESPPLFGLGAAVLPGENAYVVRRAFDNTPANDAGLRKGDIIVEIDGQPIMNHGCERHKSNDNGPTSQTCLIERNGERFEVHLTTRALVD